MRPRKSIILLETGRRLIFFEGGSSRGFSQHTNRTGLYLAWMPGSAVLPASGEWVMHNGAKATSCYTGSPPRLTVTSYDKDGTQTSSNQYVFDSGSWSRFDGTPAVDTFIAKATQ